MRILFVTKEHYYSQRPTLVEFFPKEMSKYADITYVQPYHSNEFRGLKCKEISPNKFVINHYAGKNLIVKAFSLILFHISLILFLNSHLKKNRYDIIHTWGDLYGTIICNFFQKKFDFKISFGWAGDFLDLYKLDLQKDSRLGFLKKASFYFYFKLFKKTLSLVDLFCPISTHLDKKLRLNFKIDCPTFPIPESATRLFLERAKKNFNDFNNREIVYIGAICEERDTEFLIRTISLVAKTHPDIKLKIIGWFRSEKYKNKLETLVSELGIEKNIIFYGRVDFHDIPRILKTAYLGISNIPPEPHFITSTPTKVIEYLSLGLPVIANYEIFDQDYILRNSKGGIRVKYSTLDFSKAICWVLDNEAKTTKMAKLGRKWIMKNRTYENLSFDLIKKYEVLIS